MVQAVRTLHFDCKWMQCTNSKDAVDVAGTKTVPGPRTARTAPFFRPFPS